MEMSKPPILAIPPNTPLIVVIATRPPTKRRNLAANAVAASISPVVNVAANLQTPIINNIEIEIEISNLLILAVCHPDLILVNATRPPTKRRNLVMNFVAASISSSDSLAATLQT